MPAPPIPRKAQMQTQPKHTDKPHHPHTRSPHRSQSQSQTHSHPQRRDPNSPTKQVDNRLHTPHSPSQGQPSAGDPGTSTIHPHSDTSNETDTSVNKKPNGIDGVDVNGYLYHNKHNNIKTEKDEIRLVHVDCFDGVLTVTSNCGNSNSSSTNSGSGGRKDGSDVRSFVLNSYMLTNLSSAQDLHSHYAHDQNDDSTNDDTTRFKFEITPLMMKNPPSTLSASTTLTLSSDNLEVFNTWFEFLSNSTHSSTPIPTSDDEECDLYDPRVLTQMQLGDNNKQIDMKVNMDKDIGFNELYQSILFQTNTTSTPSSSRIQFPPQSRSRSPSQDSRDKEVLRSINLSKLIGAFLSTAEQICNVIVNELALPSILKSIHCTDLNLKSYSVDLEAGGSGSEGEVDGGVEGKVNGNSTGGVEGAEGDDDDGSENETESGVYVHNGIIYRLHHPTPAQSSTPDINPSPTMQKLLNVTDEIFHKNAGNTLRNTSLIQSASALLHKYNQSKGSDTANLLPLCTPLGCIVDVLGYRVECVCMVPCEGDVTLAYGKLDVSVGAEEEDEFLMEDDNLNASVHNVFKTLNLKQHSIPSHNSPNGVVQIFSAKNVQAHQTSDSRQYLTNLTSIMPLDLPVVGSCDLFTKQLRSEFLLGYKGEGVGGLSCDSFLVHGGSGGEEDRGNDNDCINASLNLRSAVITSFVQQLDDLSIPTPTSSHELSQLMHKHGINLRHIGIIYSLTTLPHMKLLLLTEATARCAKTLLNQTLKSARRKCAAQIRGSEGMTDEDYFAHNNAMNESVHGRVVDLLNLVVGGGAESDAFYTRTLLPMLNVKFGIALDSVPKKRSVVMNQNMLVKNLCVQCGITLTCSHSHSSSQQIHLHGYGYDFASPNPLSLYDIAKVGGKVKYHPNTQLYGNVIANNAEAYIERGDLRRGMECLVLRLGLYHIIHRDGSSGDGSGEENGEDIALILHEIAHTHYHMHEFKRAVDTCYHALTLLRFSATMLYAKVNVVLMQAHFKLSNIEDSLVCYNNALTTSSKHLGQLHPFAINLNHTLSDLYYTKKEYQPALHYTTKALQCAAGCLSTWHILVPRLHTKIAYLLLHLGDVNNARLIVLKALEYYEKLNSITNTTNNNKNGKNDKNDKNDRTGAGMEMEGMEGRIEMASLYYTLSNAYSQLGDSANALMSARKSLEIRLHLSQSQPQPQLQGSISEMGVCDSYCQVAKIYEGGEGGDGERDASRNYEMALKLLKSSIIDQRGNNKNRHESQDSDADESVVAGMIAKAQVLTQTIIKLEIKRTNLNSLSTGLSSILANSNNMDNNSARYNDSTKAYILRLLWSPSVSPGKLLRVLVKQCSSASVVGSVDSKNEPMSLINDGGWEFEGLVPPFLEQVGFLVSLTAGTDETEKGAERKARGETVRV